MPLEPGQSLAHYRIESRIGAGGMGEVYRATDMRLHREVALKVLPDAFARDHDRMMIVDRASPMQALLNPARFVGWLCGPPLPVTIRRIRNPLQSDPTLGNLEHT